MNTTFRKVLSHVSQANSVRLLPWFLSATAKSGADPACSVSEVLTAVTTSELKGTTSLVSTSSPAHRVSTSPLVLPALDILATGTPVGHSFFTPTLSLKHKKWDHSPGSTPEDQSGKRAHTGKEEGNVSSGCSTLPNQPVASHSPKKSEPELVNLPSSPVKAAADPNNRLAVDTSGSTIDHDRDFVVEVSRDDTNQSGNELDSSRPLVTLLRVASGWGPS